MGGEEMSAPKIPLLEAVCPKCKAVTKFYREEIGERRECWQCKCEVELIDEGPASGHSTTLWIGYLVLVIIVTSLPLSGPGMDGLVWLLKLAFIIGSFIYVMRFRSKSSRN